MTAQFRIGGVYRDKAGRTIQLRKARAVSWTQDEALAWWVEKGFSYGARLLSTGKCPVEDRAEFDLLPGELHNVNGQWVPVAEEAPKTAKDPMAGKSVAAIFGGLSSRVSTGSKTIEDYIREAMQRPRTVGIDWAKGCAPAAEKVRPPLTWATPAKFDPWKGFFTEPADIADWQDTYFPR